MLKVPFSSPQVIANCSGRDEKLPEDAVASTVTMKQTHSNNVVHVTQQYPQIIENCDALITTLHNVELRVMHADCLPILLHHPSGVIAAVHAGRKGTELGIITEVLKQLQSEYKLIDSLEIWFGPAICQECYQINKETNLHYDLIAHNTNQIRSLFPESQATILYSNSCTAHENNAFYSYRKERPGVPMNWCGIVLTSNTLTH